MKGETKGTQAERCKRTKHHVTINQRELKKKREDIKKYRNFGQEKCLPKDLPKEQEDLVWRRIMISPPPPA